MDTTKHHRNLNVMMFGSHAQHQNLILANIMQANSSFVLPDEDGELHNKTRALLETNGFHVHVIECRNGAIEYDPLYNDTSNLGDWPMYAYHLAEYFQPSDDIWDSKALQCLIHAINMHMPAENRTMDNLLDYLQRSQPSLDEIFQAEPNEQARALYLKWKMCILKEEQREYVKEKYVAILKESNFTNSGFKWDDVCTGKHAVFVVHKNTPHIEQAYSLMVNQLAEAITAYTSTLQGKRLAFPMTIVMPYACKNIRHMAISACRYNVSFIIPQDSYPALRRQYPDSYDMLYASCDTCILGDCKEYNTLEWFSKELGSIPYGVQKPQRRNVALNEISRRQLMEPYELHDMPSNECIVLIRAVKPICSVAFDAANHPNYDPRT